MINLRQMPLKSQTRSLITITKHQKRHCPISFHLRVREYQGKEAKKGHTQTRQPTDVTSLAKQSLFPYMRIYLLEVLH